MEVKATLTVINQADCPGRRGVTDGQTYQRMIGWPEIRETDRVRLGFVIDFILVHAGDYHWPAFNVADASITFGALLLAYDLIFGSRKEERVPLTKESATQSS